MHVANSRKALLLLLALLAGTALRLWFVHKYPQIEGDSLIYGDIAKNLLHSGVYGRTLSGIVHPTLIRLPGYPLFLAACFSVLGIGHYRAVLYVQVAVDLASCLLIASFVRRIGGERQGWIALWLAVLCPFTANYTANAMAETLSVFCVALALYAMALLLQRPSRWAVALLAFAFSFAALLRADGALLAVAFLPAFVIYGSGYSAPWAALSPALGLKPALRYALLIGLLSVMPFLPWTLRNWHTFHVFQPLAPRYATDPGELTSPGLQQWMKTWCVDFASTYEIYWNVDNDRLDIKKMPSRAFDSREQYAITASIFDEHNKDISMTPELDARLQALADQRIHGHLLRYYLWLPAARVANMWLRPRVEDLPIELRWWQYWLHHPESYRVFAYEALNLAYLVAALAGLSRKPPLAGAMLAYIVLRSLLLGTIEAPETRYTLECFPMIVALAAMAFSPRKRSDSTYARPAYRAQS